MRRVLIVDDNAENLMMLRTLLEGHSFRVDSARNGIEALDRARQVRPDLVVSDLLMPSMDGYTLLRNWKDDASLAGVPFVVYTATYLEAADEELARDLGAVAFLCKPMDPEEFVARIHQILDPAAPALPTFVPFPPVDQPELLKRHAETLIRKLDEKTRALEAANALLREDICRREAAEASLRQSEWLLRLAGKAARLGGWSYEVAENRITWSEQVCEIHEAPPGTAPDLAEAIQFYAPEFRGTIRDAMEACLRDGKSFDDELQIVTTKGRRLWVRAIGHAERGPGGAILRVQGAFQDIDDHHRLEAQYRQSQKMDVVGRLAGGVAHDFNNLLTVINGYCELVLRGLERNHPVREMVTMIAEAGERSATLTRQLLTFSRQEVTAARVIRIDDTLRNLDKMLRRIIGEDVHLHLRLSSGPGTVLLDPGQLEQVIMNLAINARDAMPGGGDLTLETGLVEIDPGFVKTHLFGRPGPHVMLAVSDTGSGIPPGIRERIFEPFFTTKPAGRGTGLGLSVVHGIVKQHGGHVEVYSEPGIGTTFKIYWPVKSGIAVREEVGTATAELPAGTETVLLVEDDPMVRSFARAVLQQCGYTVVESPDPRAALALAEKGEVPFQALITDVVMPGMGGRQLATAILECVPAIRVLYISGYTEDAIVRHGMLHGEIHFLQKPFTPQALARTLRTLLDS